MIVSMIAALTQDRLLGNPDGGIPWDLPQDRAHFRAYTGGKWLLVGRRTYGEMDGWFGERRPIVLTRSPQSLRLPPGHRSAGSVPAAIDLAKSEGARELVVCGGAQVYASALPWAERLVLTCVEFETAAAPDSPLFPEWNHDAEWRTLARESWAADGQNKAGATLLILARRRSFDANPQSP